MKIVLCGVISLSLVASSALAQEGPNYTDTVNFLFQKIGPTSASDTFSISSHSRCLLETREEWYGMGWMSQRYIRQVNLSDLDPSRVETNQYKDTVYAYARNNKSAVRDIAEAFSKSGAKQLEESYDRGSDVFYVGVPEGQNNAERVIRALSHLIVLCGGREELF